MQPVMVLGLAATADQPYFLTDDTAPASNGTVVSCTLKKAGGYSATFSATGAAI
jgi:hypothetical protein